MNKALKGHFMLINDKRLKMLNISRELPFFSLKKLSTLKPFKIMINLKKNDNALVIITFSLTKETFQRIYI